MPTTRQAKQTALRQNLAKYIHDMPGKKVLVFPECVCMLLDVSTADVECFDIHVPIAVPEGSDALAACECVKHCKMTAADFIRLAQIPTVASLTQVVAREYPSDITGDAETVDV